MSNATKGLLAGFIATLAISVLMILNDSLGFIPQINIIRLLTSLGTISVPSAWMDHFIVGVVVWGLLFAVYDGIASRPALVLKGLIFGTFAWAMMMVAFLPLAGAGFLGAKMNAVTLVGLLMLHLVYGAVLGVSYGFLGGLVPVKVPGSSPEEKAAAAEAFVIPVRGPDYSFNDDLPSGSPSGKTIIIFLGCLFGFLALLVLVMEFRSKLGF